MLLSDRDLTAAIKAGDLGVEPFQPGLVQPSSIEVLLDHRFLVWEHGSYDIDPRFPPRMREQVVPIGQPFRLMPGRMALGATVEQVTFGRGLAGRVEGKSSLGRLGLAVHVTAGFIDPGFSGAITLELVNQAPQDVLLWPGMAIGQLCVFRLSSDADFPYGSDVTGSHYQGQVGPTASRSYERFQIWPTGGVR